MNKRMKIVTVALAACMTTSVALVASGCGNSDYQKNAYTYRTYSTALANNWNPHTWETNADATALEYISSPLVDMSIKDTKNNEYQWVFEMATDVKDVTTARQDDLVKYKATDLNGMVFTDATKSAATEGYVFEIKLNQDAAWENGEAINADDYIYSMQQLLNSKMRNYRANLYYAGESELAGAAEYYDSETPVFDPVVPAYGENDTPDYSFDITAKKVYINLESNKMTFYSISFAEMKDDYGYIRNEKDESGKVIVPGADYYDELAATADPYGYIEVTEDNKAKILVIMDQYASAFGESVFNEDETVNEDLYKEFLFYDTGRVSDKVSYDTVGFYKVDDYTVRYVCERYLGYDYFMSSLTSNWLVYEDLYEAGKDTTGTLTTTNYGTSKETTMSYGVYKLDTYQAEKTMIFTQNENWYGWEDARDEEGNLVSYTNFKVDGENVRQYQTTRVRIDVMDSATARQAFLKGELTEWTPQANEISEFNMSDRMYRVPETYTMSFFFNTNLDALRTMDSSKGNQNSVVLSNTNFRKAMSLAINRSDFVTVTTGYEPAYSLMNDLYYYDIYNDPTSVYRDTDEAMQAICNLYGVEYGADKTYKTLEDAYNSITGYNLSEAKTLMKQACDELVAAGLYTAGQPIKIRIAWAAGALTSDDNAQLAKIQGYLNAAVEGSGFGTITLEAIGNLNNRYATVPAGEYAIGYGAWGGAAFYPFRNFQVYMDPSQYDLNEAACWKPDKEDHTLTLPKMDENGNAVAGETEEVTMTWQDWSNCMIDGKYAIASNEIKLAITAQLEEDFLNLYYRIPLCSTTVCSLLSYQCEYPVQTYNIMYGFGGLRLMTYNMDDADWIAQAADMNYV